MCAERGQENAKFNIKPKYKTVPFEPTQAEIAAEEKRKIRAAADQKRQGYVSWSNTQPVYPETQRICTGEYSLVIDGWASGARKSWSDGKTQTLEGVFNDAVIGIDAFLLAAKARREDHEDWKRRYDLDREREARAARRDDREKKRVEFMRRLNNWATEAQDIRAWLERAPPALDDATLYGRLVEWAKDRLALLDAQSDPRHIEEMLADTDLFPEVDPLADADPNTNHDD